MDVYIYVVFCIEIPVNRVDPDQMPQNLHFAASEQGLHCLHNTQKGIRSKTS